MAHEAFPEKPGHVLLKFSIREAPEGWWLFFEDAQWGPFATRQEALDLRVEMTDFLSKQFSLPINEVKTVQRRDKELMPWVKPKRKRGKR